MVTIHDSVAGALLCNHSILGGAMETLVGVLHATMGPKLRLLTRDFVSPNSHGITAVCTPTKVTGTWPYLAFGNLLKSLIREWTAALSAHSTASAQFYAFANRGGLVDSFRMGWAQLRF